MQKSVWGENHPRRTKSQDADDKSEVFHGWTLLAEEASKSPGGTMQSSFCGCWGFLKPQVWINPFATNVSLPQFGMDSSISRKGKTEQPGQPEWELKLTYFLGGLCSSSSLRFSGWHCPLVEFWKNGGNTVQRQGRAASLCVVGYPRKLRHPPPPNSPWKDLAGTNLIKKNCLAGEDRGWFLYRCSVLHSNPATRKAKDTF